MPESQAQLEELILHATEGLSVELKAWIDPNSQEGGSAIVRAALAMRNFDGGYLLIGFDDKTGKPLIAGRPADIRKTYSKDELSKLIGKYASEKFDFDLAYVQREGAEYPVLVFPAGATRPVVCKADLKVGDRFLLRDGEVYVRSLNSNNTPSSTRANWKDWPALMDRCFDNREADIGRFARRHLSGLSSKSVRQLAAVFNKPAKPVENSGQILDSILYAGAVRDAEILTQKKLKLPDLGFWEAVFFGRASFPKSLRPDYSFLDLVKNGNPQYSGWPLWLDGRAFVSEEAKPYVYHGVWESHRINLDNPQKPRHVEFIRLDPTGRFYLKRALMEDLPIYGPLPNDRFFDLYAQARHVADAILTGLSIARTLKVKDSSELRFGFRWEGLAGRYLASDNPNLIIVGVYKAVQNDFKKLVRVPMTTAANAIAPYVMEIVGPLANAFGGYSARLDVIESIIDRLIRRLVP